MKKLLIVEDEPAYASLLCNVLAQTYEVWVAVDGQEGLDLALRHHPHLILLDIKMPVMDGMTVLKELRKTHYGKTAKVVVLTNLEPSETIIEQVIRELPISYWIKSDLEFSDIINRAHELLSPIGQP